jgi:hypothetical protein
MFCSGFCAIPTRPVAVFTVCIGEEVICLDWPAHVAVAGLGSNISSWRGVEHIHPAVRIDVVNQPAQQVWQTRMAAP